MRKTLPFLVAGGLLGVGSLLGVLNSCRGEPVAKAADQTTAPASPSASDADKALDEYKALKPPPLDRSKVHDPEYVKSFNEKAKAFMKEQAKRAKEFADAFPNHPGTPKVLLQRWTDLARLDDFHPVLQETQKALEAHPDSPGKDEILYIRAAVSVRPEVDLGAATEAVEAFLKADPKEEQGADLLLQLSAMEPDPAEQRKLEQRVVAHYANTPAAERAEGLLRQLDKIGKPFDLSFTDAISGKPVSLKDLKGKVVVVDFWATWCGPCVAEMPHMKEIYAKYKDQGVEFVGVNLNEPESEGGLKSLKEFVEKNGIAWPQYYQGNGWESEFSKSWDVTAIPCIFVLDKEGRLRVTNAVGRLDKVIPEVLKG